jgi:adenine phosphoribosyltransferase
MTDLARLIQDVPGYPTPGVMFRDITPLIGTPGGLAAAVEALVSQAPDEVDVVLGIEARGFIFGPPVALAKGAGFVPVRKPAKLPREVVTVTYDLEYGTETLAMHADAFAAGAKVLVVDDVLATGGTIAAAAELVARLGGELVGVGLLAELTYLGGREKLDRLGIGPVSAVVTLDAA